MFRGDDELKVKGMRKISITKIQISMSLPLLLLMLLQVINFVHGQVMTPELPEKYNQKRYGSLFRGINQCAFKEVKGDSGSNYMAWICGPVDENDSKVKYDCCPGYKKSPIVNNECVERTPTYKKIYPTLVDMEKVETADILEKVEPSLNKNGKDFTVFVPEQDSSLQKVKEEDISNLLVPGRYNSGDFKSGTDIPTIKGYPLKISSYRNGLVFVECQLLTKPGFETTNGIIHVTSGPIEASTEYATVLDRLIADPDVSEFTADIPVDLQDQLSAPNSKERYTVFAPTNSAWTQAKRGINDPQVLADLVKQHVKDGLTCGLSIDDQNRLLGPSKANTYIRGNQEPDGKRVLKDPCGGKAEFEKMDIMAGNGVVHKLSQALKSPASMDFSDALNCLANGPDKDLSQGAREMAACGIKVQAEDETIVLLPTPAALRQSPRSSCSLYQNHVLTSQECKIKNGYGIGMPQECLYTTKYTTPDGRHPTFTNQYIRTREGSRLHFGKAETTSLRPIPFRGGVIYPVNSVNPAPTKTMMEIIKESSQLRETHAKMQKAEFDSVLKQHSPNVVFFAPLDRGWGSRKESAYNASQLRGLFELHTVPHQLITGKDGNIDSETIQDVKSVSGTELKIKRTLDGNTFIGYDGLDPNHWAMAVGDPIVASDGVVSVVDWPLVCETC
ncbi:hypothetical protein Aperf_G00000029440 [Anoplocephala perfoliata]